MASYFRCSSCGQLVSHLAYYCTHCGTHQPGGRSSSASSKVILVSAMTALVVSIGVLLAPDVVGSFMLASAHEQQAHAQRLEAAAYSLFLDDLRRNSAQQYTEQISANPVEARSREYRESHRLYLQKALIEEQEGAAPADGDSRLSEPLPDWLEQVVHASDESAERRIAIERSAYHMAWFYGEAGNWGDDAVRRRYVNIALRQDRGWVVPDRRDPSLDEPLPNWLQERPNDPSFSGL